MNVPKLLLTPDQKLWLSSLISYYISNEQPDSAKLLLILHDKISQNFNPSDIDSRLFCNKELNIYGIFCCDSSNEFLKHVDSILHHIKQNLLNKKDVPVSFSAEELAKVLNIPDAKVKSCIKLISHVYLYWDGKKNDNSSFTVESSTVIQNYLKYESIDSLLTYFHKTPHQIPVTLAAEIYTAQKVGYLVKNSLPSNRLFLHKKVLQSDLVLLLTKNRRGPKKRSDIPRISDSSARTPQEFDECPKEYVLRVEWIPIEISSKTLFRVLNFSITDALSLIDHLRMISK